MVVSVAATDPDPNEEFGPWRPDPFHITITPTGNLPRGLVATDEGIWTVGRGDGTLNLHDRRTGDRLAVLAVPNANSMRLDDGFIWIKTFAGTYYRVDPASKSVVVDNSNPESAGPEVFGSLWVIDAGGTVTRTDLKSGVVTATISVPGAAAASVPSLSVSDSYIWVDAETSFVRIDPATNAALAGGIPAEPNVGDGVHPPTARRVDSADGEVLMTNDDGSVTLYDEHTLATRTLNEPPPGEPGTWWEWRRLLARDNGGSGTRPVAE